MLPASANEQSEEALNIFLRTQRVISVRTEFVSGVSPCWCVLVEYVHGQEPLSSKSANKIDYMKVLPPDEFAVFSKLRELRKELAAKDSVPPFVVYTDEQLAAIVKAKPVTIEQLVAVQGVGHAKAEKYGEATLKTIVENAPPKSVSPGDDKKSSSSAETLF